MLIYEPSGHALQWLAFYRHCPIMFSRTVIDHVMSYWV